MLLLAGIVLEMLALAAPALAQGAGKVQAASTDSVEREWTTGAQVVILYRRGHVPPTARTVSELIAATDAGVVVQPTTGVLGAATRIRLRGPSSVGFSNEPLITVDGVPISGAFGAADLGGVTAQRLDDIDPDDVEEIDALMGVAAAALYGPGAASGVLAIRTRQGRPGRPVLTVQAEPTLVRDAGHYPANYVSLQELNPGAQLLGADGRIDTTAYRICYNYQAATGACLQQRTTSFSPLADRRTSPFSAGRGMTYGATLAGGAPRASYYLSAHGGREVGVLSWNHRDRLSLRANADAQPTRALRLGIRAGYTDNRLALPYDGGGYYSPVMAGLLGSAVYVPPAAGAPTPNPANYYRFSPVDSVARYGEQRERRLVAAGAIAYAPLAWLGVHARLGADVQARDDSLPVQALPFTMPPGRDAARSTSTDWWGEAALTTRLQPLPRLSLAVDAGVERRKLRNDQSSFYPLWYGYTRVVQDYSMTGPLLEVRGMFAGRLAFNGVVRHDWTGDSPPDEHYGQGVPLRYWPRAATFPAGALSWVIRDSSSGASGRWLQRLRIRAAAGSAPPWATMPFWQGDAPAAGLSSGAAIAPQRLREVEAGADATLLGGRLLAGASLFTRGSIHGGFMLQVGSGSVFEPADVRTRGGELSLAATVVSTHFVTLRLDASAAGMRAKTKTYEQLPTFALNGWEEYADGYSPGSYFAKPYTFADRDGNGLLSPDEVSLTADTAVYLGPSLPTFSRTFHAQATLPRRVIISALLEWRGGNKQYDATDEARCNPWDVSYSGTTDRQRGCAANADPHASLADQARWIAHQYYGTDAGYIRDASFVKWRELTVSVADLPLRLGGAGALRATLTLSVRNLMTWTRYPGLDPEAVAYPLLGEFTQEDDLNLPEPRSYAARVTLAF